MDNNLISMKKLHTDIKVMKLLSIFLEPKKRKQLKDIETKLLHMTKQFELFNKRFSNHGWCAYDTINFSLIESANNAFESEGIETAEKVLLHYYKNDVKDNIHYLRARSTVYMERYDLILNAFDDHFSGRYYASIPLFLIIIDGAVNDFTKSKGFFAEGTDMLAWDCLVGCNDGLTKLKDIFNKGRNKTNKDEIFLPYRNGILHGRDLNYANEYVSCKCVALLFALADWMNMKNSENQRKINFEKEMNPLPISESLKIIKQHQIDKNEIVAWKARNIVVGTTVKPFGSKEDYIDYPYLLPIIEMFEAWEVKNYGKLSLCLKSMFPCETTEKKRAGECRELFQDKSFLSYQLIEIEERACSLTRVLVKVEWSISEKLFSENMEFGCVFQDEDGRPTLPWRPGNWIIKPWNVQGLYKS